MNENKEVTQHENVIFIDKQKFKIEETEIVACSLLANYAKEDPAQTTLVLKEGNDLKKYGSNETVVLKNGMHFIVYHNEPTTVS